MLMAVAIFPFRSFLKVRTGCPCTGRTGKIEEIGLAAPPVFHCARNTGSLAISAMGPVRIGQFWPRQTPRQNLPAVT